MKESTQSPEKAEARGQARRVICKVLIARMQDHVEYLNSNSSKPYLRSSPHSEKVLAYVITSALELNDTVLLLEAFDAWSNVVLPSTFRSFGKLLVHFDMPDLLPK